MINNLIVKLIVLSFLNLINYNYGLIYAFNDANFYSKLIRCNSIVPSTVFIDLIEDWLDSVALSITYFGKSKIIYIPNLISKSG